MRPITYAFLFVPCVIIVQTCNTKTLAGFIVNHEEEELKLYCKKEGEQCIFDRNCCEGLECKMSAEDEITYLCQFRLLLENYDINSTTGQKWEDYQELQSEEMALRNSEIPLQVLEDKNTKLWSKILELMNLRKEMDRIELKNLKKEFQEAEIKRLKEQKERLETQDKMDLKRMQFVNEYNQLEELERQEVNRTLLRQQAMSQVYRDMLQDLIQKEQAEAQTPNKSVK